VHESQSIAMCESISKRGVHRGLLQEPAGNFMPKASCLASFERETRRPKFSRFFPDATASLFGSFPTVITQSGLLTVLAVVRLT
jgi:hypothetical protein